jgi:hypothetical protein
LCFVKGKMSGIFFPKSMDLGMFDMSRSDRNNERYIIPMHKKNVWTKWMQDPRKNFL